MPRRSAAYCQSYLRQRALRLGFLVDVMRALGQGNSELQLFPCRVEPTGVDMGLSYAPQRLYLLMRRADHTRDVEGLQEMP
jgi:hypothetical protein